MAVYLVRRFSGANSQLWKADSLSATDIPNASAVISDLGYAEGEAGLGQKQGILYRLGNTNHLYYSTAPDTSGGWTDAGAISGFSGNPSSVIGVDDALYVASTTNLYLISDPTDVTSGITDQGAFASKYGANYGVRGCAYHDGKLYVYSRNGSNNNWHSIADLSSPGTATDLTGPDSSYRGLESVGGFLYGVDNDGYLDRLAISDDGLTLTKTQIAKLPIPSGQTLGGVRALAFFGPEPQLITLTLDGYSRNGSRVAWINYSGFNKKGTTDPTLPSSWFESTVPAARRVLAICLARANKNAGLQFGGTTRDNTSNLHADVDGTLKMRFKNGDNRLTLTGTGTDTENPYEWTPTESSDADAVAAFHTAAPNSAPSTMELELAVGVDLPNAGELTFGSESIDDQSYPRGAAITTLQLPAATGGNDVKTYSISPTVPNGLSFSASDRQITGTPTTEATAVTYTYTCTDGATATATLTFTITITAAAALSFGSNTISNQSYYKDEAITTLQLPAATGGYGTKTYSISPTVPTGLSFSASNRQITGTPTANSSQTTYTYSCTDGDSTSVSLTFTITVTTRPALGFGSQTIPNYGWLKDTAITDITLPEATGGTGTLTYSLSGTLPNGISFTASSRKLSGTPTAVQSATSHTYKVTDGASKTASITFTISVGLPALLPDDITYKVWLDDDYDGTDHSDGTAITSIVHRVEWTLGMGHYEDRIAAPLQLEVTVVDPTRKFTDPSDSDYTNIIGKIIGVRATGQNFAEDLAIGWITEVIPEQRHYAQFSVIRATCKLADLMNRDYVPATRTNVTVKQELDAIFSSGIMPWPYARDFWILGETAFTDSNMKFYTQEGTTFDNSSQTMPWVGDNADDGHGVAVGSYLMDLLGVENLGRIFTGRNGRIVFHARGHDSKSTSITMTDSWIMDYEAAQPPVFNVARVRFYPRSIGSEPTVVYTERNVPMTIAASETIEYQARYNGSGEAGDDVVSARDIIPIKRGVDWESTGGTLSVAVEGRGQVVNIGLRNAHSSEAASLTRLQVRGYALRQGEASEVVSADTASIEIHGYREMPLIDMRFVSTESAAQAIADAEVARWKDQATLYTKLKFVLPSYFGHEILGVGMGDKIRFQNSGTSYDGYHIIVGETHRIEGWRHTVEYLIQPRRLV